MRKYTVLEEKKEKLQLIGKFTLSEKIELNYNSPILSYLQKPKDSRHVNVHAVEIANVKRFYKAAISADSNTDLGDGKKHRVSKRDRIRVFFEMFKADKWAYIIADESLKEDDANGWKFIFHWDLYEDESEISTSDTEQCDESISEQCDDYSIDELCELLVLSKTKKNEMDEYWVERINDKRNVKSAPKFSRIQNDLDKAKNDETNIIFKFKSQEEQQEDSNMIQKRNINKLVRSVTNRA